MLISSFLDFYHQKCIILILFYQYCHLLLRSFFPIGLVMIMIIQYLISRDLLKWNRLILAMIAFSRCKHSKSMDWIDWKLSKLARIRLLRRRMVIMEMKNRNHSTYWIVNHWNRFKSMNIASVILEANLIWRIYPSWNPFKLV